MDLFILLNAHLHFTMRLFEKSESSGKIKITFFEENSEK